MSSNSQPSRPTILVVFALVALVGCGSGARVAVSSTVRPSVPPTEAATIPTDPASTRAPDTSTTPPTSATTTTGATTTTTAPHVEPLTGLIATDLSATSRRALAVKIDGHFAARPQFALDQADVVIEEIVEGITRFMAIFHTNIPDVVGPVRSARTQDMLIVPMMGKPLFAWSGGNAKVTEVVRKAPVVNLSASGGLGNRGVWFRTAKRKAPHNLLARGAALFALSPPGSHEPPALFQFRKSGEAVGGRAVAGARITMSGTRVQWMWDVASKRWLRTADGKVHVAESGARIGAENIVVLEVGYKPSPADPNSPEAQTMGTGKVLVFSGGHLIVGTWTRTKRTSPWALTGQDGNPILFTPGVTWVELALAGRTAIVDVGVDPTTVRYKVK